MSLLAALAAEEHELAPMVMDPIWFPIIAAAIFLTMGLVTFSYRDVAHRNARKPEAPTSGDTH